MLGEIYNFADKFVCWSYPLNKIYEQEASIHFTPLFQMMNDPKMKSKLVRSGKVASVNHEIEKCYLGQIHHFKRVANVMKTVDLPVTFWDEGIDKLANEAQKFKKSIKL